jgi:magnesium chelatase family protein
LEAVHNLNQAKLLAHLGVLFLDELPEFDRKVLEVLRQPLESKEIVISRAARQMTFPANFQFIAAMNPCPCGYAFNQDSRCQCSAENIQRYQSLSIFRSIIYILISNLQKRYKILAEESSTTCQKLIKFY